MKYKMFFNFLEPNTLPLTYDLNKRDLKYFFIELSNLSISKSIIQYVQVNETYTLFVIGSYVEEENIIFFKSQINDILKDDIIEFVDFFLSFNGDLC